MLTVQVCIWAENASVGVSQWAAETMWIWQKQAGLTTQWQDNEVRERFREIALSMSISHKQGANRKQWVLLINRCVTRISDLASTRPLGKRYLAEITNLDGEKPKAAQDKFADVGLR